MYGETPEDAVQVFLDTIRQAIDCVTTASLTVYGGYYPSATPHRLTLTNNPVRLTGPSDLWLKLLHFYRVIEDPSPLGPWRVTTSAYYYALEDRDGAEIVAYHWHPRPDAKVKQPHFHLGRAANVRREEFRRVHFPTGRIAIEDVLQLAISELGVTPLQANWSRILDQTRAAFETARGWPRSGIPSPPATSDT